MTSLRSAFFPLLLTSLLILALGSPAAQAQQAPPDARALLNPTVKEYGRAGYPKITVYVWGNADTGVWNVEKGTDLLEFVSVVSRLPMTDNNPESRRVETLRLYRDQNPGGDALFESKVEKLFARRGNYPALQEGDILVIESETRTRFTWRDIARVTGTVATVLNTYLLLDRIQDNN
jgi:hypothetical protein